MSEVSIDQLALTEENNNLRQQIQQLTCERDSALSMLDENIRGNMNYRTEVLRCRTQLNERDGAITALRAQIEADTAIKADLENKLKEATAELELLRDAWSKPEESVSA